MNNKIHYTNPIIPGFHPDPSICRVGKDFYLVTSSFEYFPGVPLFHSVDLTHWEQIGYCLTRETQLPLKKAGASGGIFAPTIRYYNGRFYMVTTNVSHGGHFYVWTDDIAGEWSEPMWVEHPGIDPSFLFCADGRVIWTSNKWPEADGLFGAEIDIETGKLKSESVLLWEGIGAKAPEGPHLYQIGEWFYLMVAEGGTEYGHLESIARSRDPFGPYESCPHNPILTNRSMKSPIQATGHADLIDDADGNWWLVFLGVRPVWYPPAYHLGRETHLAPVVWDADGWPVVNDGKQIVEEMSGPLPPQQPAISYATYDDFDEDDEDAYAVYWNFVRNPDMSAYSLTERPGWLRLYGACYTPDDCDAFTCICRRQQHFDCTFRVKMEFDPQREGEEAGILVRANETHHYECGILREGNQNWLILRKRIGSLCAITDTIPVSANAVILEITADKKTYTFSRCEADGSEKTIIGTAETRYVSTEVAGGFTGVFFCIYATGRGKKSTTPADFDWCEYKENK